MNSLLKQDIRKNKESAKADSRAERGRQRRQYTLRASEHPARRACSHRRASICIRDITIIGMMSAILVAVQLALSFLPNIELVSLLIILFTLIFGWKTLYIIYIFITVEGLLFGFGIWWFSWLYIWPVLFLITKIFHRLRSFYYWAIISGIFGLSFGALYAITIAVLDGPSAGFGAWVQGIIFDLIHGIGNFGVTLVLFRPLYFVLDKINRQFWRRDG